MTIPQAVPEPTVDLRPVDFFILDPKEEARHDPEKALLLGKDMIANGQLSDLLALVTGRLIGGHGRVLGARAVGIKMLRAKLYPASMSDTQIKLIGASDNLQRSDYSAYQKYLIFADLLCGNPDWTQQTLAERLHLQASAVCRYLSPAKCIDAAQEALRDGKIGIGDTYAISKLPRDQQAGLLALKLGPGGATRDQMEAASRKARAPTAPSVKVGKIRCDLPGNLCVVVSGEAVSLEDGVEALAAAAKAMKSAIQDGFTAKTFAAAMKDKSRKE